jgi:hypothetical protein
MSLGRPVNIGDLFDRFSGDIPLHSAARKWTAHVGRKDVELPSAAKMRFYMLTQYLHWLKCSFDPPGRKSHHTWVVAPTVACERCGRLFVTEKTARTCSPKCRVRAA